jgi:hypothetical protein
LMANYFLFTQIKNSWQLCGIFATADNKDLLNSYCCASSFNSQ